MPAAGLAIIERGTRRRDMGKKVKRVRKTCQNCKGKGYVYGPGGGGDAPCRCTCLACNGEKFYYEEVEEG